MLSIKGRVNFLQLGRFENFKEQRYRQLFEKPSSWLDFYKELTLSHGGNRFVIAFGPSYIHKSGKKTPPGLDWYWSGCAGQAKWELQIGGPVAIDLDNHTAFHHEAVQTLIHVKQITNLVDWFVSVVEEKKEALCSISKNLVAYVWFLQKSFIDQIIAFDMHLISRSYDDGNVKYLYQGPFTRKRERPCKNDKGKLTHKLYFCIDTQMDALEILDCYQSRFQIEFLYRDGKQYSGLNDSKERSENKPNFHFNATLTAINIAKVKHWLSTPKEESKSFSMVDIKTINHNRLLLQRFIDVFDVNAYSAKNRNHVNELIYYGTIAA